jgi:hypothetical protein
LDIFDGGTVIEGDKTNILVATAATYPSTHVDELSFTCKLQGIDDFCSFHYCVVIDLHFLVCNFRYL